MSYPQQRICNKDERHNNQPSYTASDNAKYKQEYAGLIPPTKAHHRKPQMSQSKVLMDKSVADMVEGLVIVVDTKLVYTGILDIEINQWAQEFDTVNVS